MKVQTREERVQEMRWKRSALERMGAAGMLPRLWEISEEVYDLMYEDECFDMLEGVLADALGSTEAAQDLRFIFSNLPMALLAFYAMVKQYGYMKLVLDILYGDNLATMRAIQNVEEAYEAMIAAGNDSDQRKTAEARFDWLLETLPNECWV